MKNQSRYKAKCDIFTPHGIVKKGDIHTGREWKAILVFDFKEEELFEEVKTARSHFHNPHGGGYRRATQVHKSKKKYERRNKKLHTRDT